MKEMKGVIRQQKKLALIDSLYECFRGSTVSVSTSLLLQVLDVKAFYTVELVQVAGTCGKSWKTSAGQVFNRVDTSLLKCWSL